jgi:hypothetical protein
MRMTNAQALAALGLAGAITWTLPQLAAAGSVTQPGELVGLATGAPLPEGLYFLNTGDWGCRNTSPTTCAGVDIPAGVWATPWFFFGARFQVIAATPAVEVGVHHADYVYGMYNPFLAGQLAWDLGNGFGFSYALGAYFGVDTDVAFRDTSLNQRFGLSYTRDGWNLTANVTWGLFGNSDVYPDFLNLDLTATKKIGKWEVGVIGYGSTDLNLPALDVVGKQSQFAVGPLIGYDFGPVTVQAYASHDVYEKNYGGHDTRLWTRFIIPIWTPPAPPAAPLYRKG